MPNKTNLTPFEAIANNDMEAFKAWLEAGGSPDAEDKNGNSIIELLVTQHNLEGIKILSPYNPDISIKRNNIGEYSKHIISLARTENEELKDFINLEVAFMKKILVLLK